MDELTSSIQDSLPKIEKVRIRTEMDFYGFSNLLANRLNYPKVPIACLSTWKHGWIPQDSIQYPLQIAHWGTKNRFHFVHTKWQKKFLESHGYTKVEAVGAPFCYTSPARVERMPDSLLIVPVHTLSHMPFSEDFEHFFLNAANIRKNFKTAVVCLHQESVTDSVLKLLAKYNLKYILGASAHDGNSLIRMRKIFAQFECLITNQVGSHVPYFNLCGGKTAVVGPYYMFSTTQLEKHEWYRKHPELLEAARFHTEENIRKCFPFLFVDIENQTCHEEWAKTELGFANVLPDKIVANLVGWTSLGAIKKIQNHPKQAIKNLVRRDQNPLIK